MIDLGPLRTDERLSRLFVSGQEVGLELWLLGVRVLAEAEKFHLLYGLVSPSSHPEPDEWFAARLPDLPSQVVPGTGETHKYRLRKLNFNGDAPVVGILVSSLCDGNTLGQACDAAGIDHPPTTYVDFALVGPGDTVSRQYALRPLVFCPTTSLNTRLKEYLQVLTSPNPHVPAFTASLVRLDKFFFLRTSSGESLNDPWPLFRDCLRLLRGETLLDFEGADAPRLGNLEWMTFPAVDARENPQVAFGKNADGARDHDDDVRVTQANDNVIDVVVRASAFVETPQLLVGCRTMNGGAVTTDQIIPGSVTGSDVCISFTAREPITSVLISVWTRGRDTDPWTLKYQSTGSRVRSVGVGVEIRLRGERYHSQWLEQLLAPDDEAVEHDDQPPVPPPPIASRDYPNDPWTQAANLMRSLVTSLKVPTSLGAFLVSSGDEESPVESIARAINRPFSDRSVRTLVLLDPYFSDVGVDVMKVLAQADRELVGVASYKKEKKKWWKQLAIYIRDCLKRRPTKRTRRQLLVERCKEVFPPNVPGNFTALEVQGPIAEDSSKQRFHDRYALYFDKKGRLLEGLHLSNSLQKATSRFPLLVTPIPPDVLPSVGEYVRRLLDQTSGRTSQNKIVTHYSTRRVVSEPQTVPAARPTGLAALGQPGWLFSWLLGEPDLAGVSAADLKTRLLEHGVLLPGSDNFVATEQVKEGLPQLVAALQSIPPEEFPTSWATVGEWLARTHEADALEQTIADLSDSTMESRLVDFLVAAADHEREPNLTTKDDENETLGDIGEWPTCDFEDLLSKASHLWTFGPPARILGAYSISTAVRVLINMNGDGITSVLSELHQLSAAASGDRSSNRSIGGVHSVLLGEIHLQVVVGRSGGTFSDDVSALVDALIGADSRLARALGSQALLPTELSDVDITSLLEKLGSLDDSESIFALAQWVHELRIKDNQRGGAIDPDAEQLRKRAFREIVRRWPEGGVADLPSFVDRLGGPVRGSWAFSTDQHFLVAMEEAGHLSPEDSARLWLSFVFDPLEVLARSLRDDEPLDRFSYAPAFRNIMASAASAWLRVQSPEVRGALLDKVEKLCNQCRSTLYNRRNRFRQTGHWRAAAQIVLSAQCFSQLILLSSSDAQPPELTSRLETITALHEDALWEEGADRYLARVDTELSLATQLRRDLHRSG